jgi:hypothetical protein
MCRSTINASFPKTSPGEPGGPLGVGRKAEERLRGDGQCARESGGSQARPVTVMASNRITTDRQDAPAGWQPAGGFRFPGLGCFEHRLLF